MPVSKIEKRIYSTIFSLENFESKSWERSPARGRCSSTALKNEAIFFEPVEKSSDMESCLSNAEAASLICIVYPFELKVRNVKSGIPDPFPFTAHRLLEGMVLTLRSIVV
jgi:hypothetical protein